MWMLVPIRYESGRWEWDLWNGVPGKEHIYNLIGHKLRDW